MAYYPFEYERAEMRGDGIVVSGSQYEGRARLAQGATSGEFVIAAIELEGFRKGRGIAHVELDATDPLSVAIKLHLLQDAVHMKKMQAAWDEFMVFAKAEKVPV